ncbi:hypothetical protein [Streptomyces sp. RFCAC02]|uniref:hypothetical protein n=1 Tax=Streptomyces sp. RFCAC02 TaxID=2499143 RepID=UPI0010225FA8|nr:hypothetical protein [Streptomyces sp. RFCAC02]
MRNTDPFEFISQHRDTIFRVAGVLAALLIVFLIIRWLAMRQGGWAAATRRVKREFAVTGAAFAAPFRAWSRHRKALTLLVRGLRTPATWRDAERAVAAARHAAASVGATPYAVLVDDETATVLLAGRDVPEPADGPWWHDPDDGPDHWTIARQDLPPVVPVPDLPYPVLVAVGESGGCCAFLDVATGPALLTVEGERRAAAALHQAVAAQLDARLPDGQVVVAENVHRAYAGTPIRTAYRTARDLPHVLGIAPVLVTTELPDPLPPELAESPDVSPGPRILLRGTGRGHRRSLLTDRHGTITLLGTPLVLGGNALARAIARVLPDLPPVLPPAPPTGGVTVRPERAFAELDEDEEAVALAGEDAEETWAAPAGAGTRPPAAERDDAYEEEREEAPAREAAPEEYGEEAREEERKAGSAARRRRTRKPAGTPAAPSPRTSPTPRP